MDTYGSQMDGYVTTQGLNPLQLAAIQGNMDVVNYLTQRGMKTSVEDYEGFSVLARVLDVFDFSLALKLLQRGCDIDYTNRP